jgi:hypothetical protein
MNPEELQVATYIPPPLEELEVIVPPNAAIATSVNLPEEVVRRYVSWKPLREPRRPVFPPRRTRREGQE